MKKAFLALAVMFVAGSAAQAFPFWHHRHHHRHFYGATNGAPNDPRNPGGIYNGQ